MSEYRPTIGLEIHVELKTATKMFCDCPNSPDDTLPNENVCPVCLAHPGAMPVPNRAAIEAVIKVGLALKGAIAPVSKFDRKNYFYPDLPKGYQISQYDQPLVLGGELAGAHLTRIHLEEDTAKLAHVGGPSDSSGQATSLVDYNRAGVPLMELVTEPEIISGDHAVRFARELQLILRYLGVSDADMEKGHMRIEPNISLATPADDAEPGVKGTYTDPDGRRWYFGTKTELKNINSFKAVQDGIAYELERQKEILESGGKIIQETRGWDEAKRETYSQRIKESAHDYRYFPEPDIPPFHPGEMFDLSEMERTLAELPEAKRARLAKEYNLSEFQADQLVSDPAIARFFEESASELAEDIKQPALSQIYNYLVSDLRGLLNETGTDWPELKINPENFADLIEMIQTGKIMSRQAKDILRVMFMTGEDPRALLEREGGVVADESALGAVVREVLAEQPKAAADFKSGKEASLQFLIGQAMRKLKGKGHPDSLAKVFRKEVNN